MSYDAVILISIDTLRFDVIGGAKQRLWPDKYRLSRLQPQTRALDRLERRGATFAHCVSAAPYTSASHATYFTGLWPAKHGVYEFFNRQLSANTIFGAARRLGYRTVFKTDFPVILGPYLGFNRDADEFIVENDEAALRSIAGAPRVFAFLHFGGVHIPYGFHNVRYGGETYRKKVAELERQVGVAPEAPGDQLVETFRSPEDMELLVRYKAIVQALYAAKEYDQLFSLYLDGVDYFMRERFDPLMDRLGDLLSGRRALIVLFGDHGEEYDDDAFGHFNSLAEGVLRVPLVIVGEGIQARCIRERTRTVDVAPTVLEAIGAPVAERAHLDGMSMWQELIQGEPIPIRDAYAQAYISDVGEFVQYQKRLLAEGKAPGALRHVRFKEAMYSALDKVTRQTHEYRFQDGRWGLRRCPAKITFESTDARGDLRPTEDPIRAASLLEALDRYNVSRETAGSAPVLTAGIGAELRNMGYRV